MTQQTLFCSESSEVQCREIETDICANRHKGHRNSVAAQPSAVYRASTRERIRIMVNGCGYQGVTLREICDAMGKLPHQVSGRISELKRDGLIFDSGRDKEGFSVLVAERGWCNGSGE